LRHGGYLVLVEQLLLYQKYYITVIIISWTICYIKAYWKILVICAWLIFNSTPKKPLLLSLYCHGKGLSFYLFQEFCVTEICWFTSMHDRDFCDPKNIYM